MGSGIQMNAATAGVLPPAFSFQLKLVITISSEFETIYPQR